MVSTELYVAGLKRKEMVEITHGSSVEGSRGTRYRLYGTYTDPVTKKIHKANSFVSKAKYDEITAKMTAGMPVADMTIEKVEVFAEDSPADAEPSDLGGPTEPDDAGVPADVGGDEPVPMGDEPSDIQEFDAEVDVGTTIDDIVMDEYLEEGEALEDAEEYARKARQALTEREADAEDVFATEQEREMEEAARKREYGYTHPIMDDYRPEFDDPNFVEEFDESSMDDLVITFERVFEDYGEDGLGEEEQVIVIQSVKVSKQDYLEYMRKIVPPSDMIGDLDYFIFDYLKPSKIHYIKGGEYEDNDRYEGLGVHWLMIENEPSEIEQVRQEVIAQHGGLYEVEEPLPEIVEEEVVEKSQRPEPGTWAGVALDMAMMSGPDDNFDWDAWKDEMKESRGAEAYEAYRKRAEMTLREWGESELEEEKHDFRQNPNESFREWIEEEVRAHGDISFREWADEEESEETKSAETVTKSAETDQDMETVDTQVAVALGIPPEIWRDTSRDKQNAYIASMMLDVTTVRDLADDGEFELIMAMANEQKETITAGDLSLIECNVCGITASQLLDDLGGVCDITDPNGGANPNWVRGVSCPFEKYYSLTRAVYDEVEEELRDSQTVVQIHTPRPAMAMAAESVSKRASRYARVGRTFNGRGYRKYRTESLMDITKDTSLGDFTSKELTESSAIQGDFDHASLNYSGRQNIQARAETLQADDFGDMEYVILVMLTDEQLEEEYGDYMRDEGIGRKELPQSLEDRYRTADEAQYLREKYLDYEDDDYDAETFRAYDDAISDRQRYKIQELGGKVDSSMNRSEASDYIKELQGRESGTWKSAETRGIDTFTEPFEETGGLSHWLGALGIAGAAVLTYFFLPKGE